MIGHLPYKKILNTLTLSSFISYACHASDAKVSEHPRSSPNIVFILADDLSWADLSCYGHKVHETPHLDQLAKEGMKFTQFYAPAPICSASRASYLTGRSPAANHLEFVCKKGGNPKGTKVKTPSNVANFPLKHETIAETLDGSNYKTAFFGKWHLNKDVKRYLAWGKKFGPLQQGFDEGFEDRGSYPSAKPRNQGKYPNDSLVDKACSFIEKNKKNPFLLYFSHYYVHTPVSSNLSWLKEKYQKKYGNQASPKKVAYAAFVETLDHYTGQLIAQLKRQGLYKNTLIIFTSDNGGHPSYTDNGILKGSKWTLYEGGIKQPFIACWPNKIKPGSLCHSPAIGWDLYPTITEIAGVKGHDKVEGLSLTKLFKGESIQRELFFHFPYYHPAKGYEGTKPCSSIRSNDGYKLLYFYEDERLELYDLNKDPSEKNDLSKVEPDRASDLKKRLLKRLDDVGARMPTK